MSEAKLRRILGRARTLWAATSVLALTQGAGGCAPTVRQEPCYALQQEGRVAFTRVTHKGWYWNASPHETDLGQLVVRRRESGVVWALVEGPSAPRTKAITYGEVPPGYSQWFPEFGTPAPLQVGDVYELTCGLGRGAFQVTPTGVDNLDPDRLPPIPSGTPG